MDVTKMVQYLDKAELGNILFVDSGGGLDIYVQEVYLPDVDTVVFGVFASNNGYYGFFTTYEEAHECAADEATSRFCQYHYR